MVSAVWLSEKWGCVGWRVQAAWKRCGGCVVFGGCVVGVCSWAVVGAHCAVLSPWAGVPCCSRCGGACAVWVVWAVWALCAWITATVRSVFCGRPRKYGKIFCGRPASYTTSPAKLTDTAGLRTIFASQTKLKSPGGDNNIFRYMLRLKDLSCWLGDCSKSREAQSSEIITVLVVIQQVCHRQRLPGRSKNRLLTVHLLFYGIIFLCTSAGTALIFSAAPVE